MCRGRVGLRTNAGVGAGDGCLSSFCSTHAYAHALLYSHKRTPALMPIHMHTHTHTHTHIYIYTHTHTHIHTPLTCKSYRVNVRMLNSPCNFEKTQTSPVTLSHAHLEMTQTSTPVGQWAHSFGYMPRLTRALSAAGGGGNESRRRRGGGEEEEEGRRGEEGYRRMK